MCPWSRSVRAPGILGPSAPPAQPRGCHQDPAVPRIQLNSCGVGATWRRACGAWPASGSSAWCPSRWPPARSARGPCCHRAHPRRSRPPSHAGTAPGGHGAVTTQTHPDSPLHEPTVTAQPCTATQPGIPRVCTALCAHTTFKPNPCS